MADELQRQVDGILAQVSRPVDELLAEPGLSRAIFDTVAALVVILDREGRICLFNRACERATGYAVDEVKGLVIWDFLIHRDEAPFVRRVFENLRTHGVRLEHENDWVARDGSRRRIAWTNAAVRDAQGEIRWILGTGLDVTERRATEAAMRESEAMYRTLFNSTGAATIIVEEDTTISLANGEFARIAGMPREEIEGKITWGSLLSAEDRDRIMEYHTLRRGDPAAAPSNYEFSLVDRNGRRRDMAVAVAMVPGTRKSIASFMDITEQKRTEEALRESEAKFKALAETSPSAIFVYRRKFLYVNPAAERLTGYSRGELLTMDYWSVVHPESHAVVQERSRARKRGDAVPSQIEFQIIRKDGEDRWLDYGETLIQFEGKPAGMGIALDITDRKRAERALRESETKFRLVAETSPTAIFVYHNRFLYANPACEELTGLTTAELEETNFWDIVHPEHRGMVKQRGLSRQMGEEVPSHYEFKILRKGGDHRWIEFAGTAIDFEGGRAGLGIAVDITRLKEMEDELRSLSLMDELTGLYNRRGFTTLAEAQIRLARRLQQELLLVFVDLDGLKAVNDTLGHQVGDQALKEAAEVMRRTFRESDLLARLGGDEFVALALNSSEAPNGEPVLRLQENIGRFNARGDCAFKLALSAGTVCVLPERHRPLEELLAEADRRMYETKMAKRQGR